ncbi:MAG: hypothetical protein QHC40_15275 [Sphingobium sp.]|nr:hypothetical protein [Sphingobium sp.]
MTDNVTNDLIYSVLQQMQADMSEMKFDIRDLQGQMAIVEEHLGSSIIAISGVNSRLDRLADRVERIEKRFDLSEHR